MRFSTLLDVVLDAANEEQAWRLISAIQAQVRAFPEVVAAIQCTDQVEPVPDSYPEGAA